MKRFLPSQQLKQSMHYYRGVPSDINNKFLKHKVDAAFISSINSKKCFKPKLGIVAKKEVTSVLVIPSDTNKTDSESATSNKLAQILHIQGEVLIGDKALLYYLHHNNYIDLALEWHKRYKLPFVFATLCYHKRNKLIQAIETKFPQKKIKIPYYILQNAAKKTDIPPDAIKKYLKLISYKLHEKEHRSLKRFLKESKLQA